MDNLFLVLRVVVSLAAVLGLLYLLRRRVVPRLGLGPAGSAQRQTLSVVARQGVGPKASVVVVDVDARRYLLGVGEQGVNVLDSYDAPLDIPVRLDQDALERSRVATHDADFRRSLLRASQELGPQRQDPAQPTTRRALREAREASVGNPATSPLAGSILSPQTWRQAAEAVRRGRSA